MFYWVAKSNDGSFEDKSATMFTTKKEAYEDMRNAVLEKVKWNTEFDEDFEKDETIDYNVTFSKDSIIHNSYSGEYVYTIYEE